MMTLLRRWFIPDYQNLASEEVRTKHGILGAWLGFLINLILVALKLTFALLLASQNNWILPMALLADAINNAGDMASNIVTLIGFKIAGKPADAEHPFGHQRMEYIAGMVVSVLVMFAGVELIMSSVEGIIEGARATYSWVSVIIFTISILLKALQGAMNLSLAKTIQSPSLKATAIDSFTDTLATLAVMVSAILGITLGWNFLDGYFGIAVAAFVIFSAIKMLKETADPLIGEAFSKEDAEEIAKIALSRKEILGVHDLLIHQYGPTKTFISLHAEVSASNDLMKIHDIVNGIEKEIDARYHAETVIHIDPVEGATEEKRKALAILHEMDSTASIHDFEQDKKTIFMDILLSRSDAAKEKALLEKLEQGLKGYSLTVRFDYPYSR